MTEEKSVLLCLVCAWRENCQKKYSMKPTQRCPDFERDLRLKPDSDAPAKGDKPAS